jgi:hypothetical protein
MTTETIPASAPDDEPMPWDTEPETDGGITVTMFLVPNTNIETLDYANPNSIFPDSRVVMVRIGDLSMHIGISGGDPEIVAAIDPLIAALHKLRDAAALRAPAVR